MSSAVLTRTRRRAARAIAAMAVCVGLLVTGAVAQADDRDDVVRQREQNAAERERLEATLEGVNTELAETYLALEDAKRRLPVAEQELADAEAELAAAERTQQQVSDRLALAEAEQETLAAEIADAQEQIDGSQEALGELARSTYRGGNTMSSLEVVFDATSTEEFVRQYAVRDTAVRTQTQVLSDLETASAVTRNRQDRQEAVTERIGELKAEADAAVVTADAARAEAADRAAEIQALKESEERLAAELEEKQAQTNDQLALLEAQEADFAAEIARIDEEIRRQEERRLAAEREEQRDGAAASRSRGGSSSSASSSLLGTPVPNPMYVTSDYGYRIYPITGGRFMHNGVDVRSACGAPQHASAAGTVVGVRPAAGNGTHGNQVLINHGVINGSSYITVYNHLSRFAVSSGQRVAQGETIGYTGATGMVTGCHVHFEVWRNGSTIDPMGLPGFVRVN